MGMLGHRGVKVIVNHHHDCLGLLTLAGVFVDRASVKRVIRPQSIHVDASKLIELGRKLGGQFSVLLSGEVAQGIAECELLFR